MVFSEIVERLKESIGDKNKVTDKEIADILGYKAVPFSQLKRRNSVPFEKILDYCRKENISPMYIFYGEGSLNCGAYDESPSYQIKLLENVTGSCGGGSDNSDESARYITLDPLFVETLGIQSKIKHIEAIKAVGDSMEPTIKDGALVLIDKSDVNIDKSGVFAVNASGSVYIKRISKSMSGMVEIISDNTLYPKESFTQEEVFVIGRILGLVERV